jgi:transcriptional repressor NrdR
MVCVYCAGTTEIVNSRGQKQTNQVWRRRRCKACKAVFTTAERVDYAKSFVVQDKHGKLSPLSRDKLLVSVLGACRHREEALQDATALTETVLAEAIKATSDGSIESMHLTTLVRETLARFDHAAAVQYQAFHPL